MQNLRARRNGRNVELYWPTEPLSQEYGIDREVNATRASADQSFNPARVNTTSGLQYTDAGVAGDGNELVLYSVRGRKANGRLPQQTSVCTSQRGGAVTTSVLRVLWLHKL
ncbi:MAG: hypothetical protein HYW25_05930 [Candidatus Aenigmarchaeota archaeon]|nr:hypothetical protein [Candidatus Aenigmarchaeota archaeon]